jgi:hypothetical protein
MPWSARVLAETCWVIHLLGVFESGWALTLMALDRVFCIIACKVVMLFGWDDGLMSP